MAKNIGTLGNFDQRRLWKLICIVNPFDLLFKKSNLSLNMKNLKWGEISLWNVFYFLKYTLDTVIGTPGNSSLESKISLKYIPIHINNFQEKWS